MVLAWPSFGYIHTRTNTYTCVCTHTYIRACVCSLSVWSLFWCLRNHHCCRASWTVQSTLYFFYAWWMCPRELGGKSGPGSTSVSVSSTLSASKCKLGGTCKARIHVEVMFTQWSPLALAHCHLELWKFCYWAELKGSWASLSFLSFVCIQNILGHVALSQFS